MRRPRVRIVVLGVLLAGAWASGACSKSSQSSGGVPQFNRCPVDGFAAADEKLTMDHKGRKVWFCSAGCMARFKKTPDKFKLDKMGEATGK